MIHTDNTKKNAKMNVCKSLMIYLTIEQCRPFKNGAFLQKLLDFRQKSLEAKQNREWKMLIPFYVVPIIKLNLIFYIIFLIVSRNTEMKALIYGDILQMFNVKKQILYLSVIQQILTSILCYQTLFNSSDDHFHNLTQVILNQETRKIFYAKYSYKKMTASLYLKKCIIFWLNVTTIFVYATGIKAKHIKDFLTILFYSYNSFGVRNTTHQSFCCSF